MDVDLECVEIVFAQKLASGEAPVRALALRELHKWLKKQSTERAFEEDDLTRLAKGLHYVMWMQDKMILQEELADAVGSLLLHFKTEEERARYLKCSLLSVSKEWPHIDKWRMDKFLMMVRRLIRAVFSHLRDLKWEENVTNLYWTAFEATVMSNDRSFRDGLKFHFASLFLDELDLAGGVSTDRVTELLSTFVHFLSISISDYVFNAVCDEIFMTILHARSEELVEEEEDEEKEEGDGDDVEMKEGGPKKDGIKFDYVAIGRLLFDAGKKPELKSARRAKLYDLAKRFDRAAKGHDPFGEEELADPQFIGKREFQNAVQSVLSMNNKVSKDKKKGTKVRKEKKRLRNVAGMAEDVTGPLPQIALSEKKYKGEGKKKKKKMDMKKGKGGKRRDGKREEPRMGGGKGMGERKGERRPGGYRPKGGKVAKKGRK